MDNVKRINTNAVRGIAVPNCSKRFRGAISMNIYLTCLAEHSLANKYFRWYVAIINRAITRATLPNMYYESHHIVPRSFRLGGETDPNNIAALTAKEHIVVHHIMTKFSIGEYRIAALRAYHCMCVKDNGGKNRRNPTILQLAAAREAVREANSGPRGINGPPAWSMSTTIEDFKILLLGHVEDGFSDPAIGKLYGVSATAIHNWRRKLDINRRRADLRNRDYLYQSYIVNKLSCRAISKNLGCTEAAVQLMLSEFDIPKRSPSERQRNRHSRSVNVDIFSGDHVTSSQ